MAHQDDVHVVRDPGSMLDPQAQQVLPLETFAQSRQRMSQAFRDDRGLYQAYHANIAMLVHDRHGVTDHTARNKLASEVMGLLFGLTEQETTPL